MEQTSGLQKIVVLNPKGGSGKSTIATNLAAYYAWRGLRVALMDHDPRAEHALAQGVHLRCPPSTASRLMSAR
jgi:cellulose biosynthesis protein BcsQ